jgi:hypothetical protein
MAIAKMTLKEYRIAIGLDPLSMASAVQQMTGVTITSYLIIEAEGDPRDTRKKPAPMARPKAEAIAQFLTKEMGRPITINDIDGLTVS